MRMDDLDANVSTKGNGVGEEDAQKMNKAFPVVILSARDESIAGSSLSTLCFHVTSMSIPTVASSAFEQ